jgi:hypothetical protein
MTEQSVSKMMDPPYVAHPPAAGTFDVDLADFVSWSHPVLSVTIYIKRSIGQFLAGRALQCSKRMPATEIGGLFLGSVLPGSPEPSVVITKAKLVNSEGPLYNQSALDLQNLKNTASQCAQAGESQIIGYFRSHIRDGLRLSYWDRQFIEQEIRDPHSVFLILRPLETGVNIASSCFWQNGCLQRDSTDLEIPFFITDLEVNRGGRNGGAIVSEPSTSAEPLSTEPVAKRFPAEAAHTEVRLPESPPNPTEAAHSGVRLPESALDPTEAAHSEVRLPEAAPDPGASVERCFVKPSPLETVLPKPVQVEVALPESSLTEANSTDTLVEAAPVPEAGPAELTPVEPAGREDLPPVGFHTPPRVDHSDTQFVGPGLKIKAKDSSSEEFLVIPVENGSGKLVSVRRNANLSTASKSAPEKKRNEPAFIQLPSEPSPPEPRSGDKFVFATNKVPFTLASVIVLAVIVAIGAYFALRPSRPQQEIQTLSGVDLGLRLTRSDEGRLNLKWSPEVLQGLSAQSAKLSITDGQTQRTFDLDKGQLRSGSITYFPATGEVQFTLDVYLGGSRLASQSMRVLRPGFAASDSSHLPKLEPSEAGASKAFIALEKQSARPALILPAPGNESVNAPSNQVEPPLSEPLPAPPNLANSEILPSSPLPAALTAIHQKIPPMRDDPPPTVARIANVTTRPLPTTAALAPTAAAADMSSIRRQVLQARDPSAQVQLGAFSDMSGMIVARVHQQPLEQQQPVAQPPSAPETRAAEPVPAPSTASSSSGDIAPRPVKQVLPDLTSLPDLSSDFDINILTQINESGRVVDARVMSSSGGPGPAIVERSIRAAKQWLFTPARSNGSNISGAYVIQFHLRKSD